MFYGNGIEIDGIGVIKDPEQLIKSIERTFGAPQVRDLYELEALIKEAVKEEPFMVDKFGRETTKIADAQLKFYGISGDGAFRIYVSFIRNENGAIKYGLGSEFAWHGCWVGKLSYLLGRYASKYDINLDLLSQMNDNNFSSSGQFSSNYNNYNKPAKVDNRNIGSYGQLLDEQDEENERGHYLANKDNYMELYGELANKEDWLDEKGSLHNLSSFVRKSWIAINNLNDLERSKYTAKGADGETTVMGSRLLGRFGNEIRLSFNLGVRGDLLQVKVYRERLYEGSILQSFKPYKSASELIFDGSVGDIDSDDMRGYEHIIRERRKRLPEDMTRLDDENLVALLRNAVERAIKIATMNYSYAVPVWLMQTGRINFALPLIYNNDVCAALIIGRNTDGRFSLRTAYTLEMVRSSARFLGGCSGNWTGDSKTFKA